MTKSSDSSNLNAAVEGSHPSRADRPTSFSSKDIAVPNGREEDWRFTPLRRINTLFDADNYEGVPNVSVTGPKIVSVETVGRPDSRLGKVLAPGDRSSVIAWEAFREATIVTIPREAELDAPVIIDVAGSASTTQAGHILITGQEMSRATVIVRHSGPATLNETVEVRADDGASLKVVTIHEWDRDATHASNHRVSVGRDARLEHLVVTLGGDLVRVSVDTEFTGPGGEMILNGIYFVDAGQHLEHRVFVDHAQPDCYSRVTYKGALQGEGAHAVWIGDCLIQEPADGTDTYELNRNLILSEGAKADSVPNLEIENGEIEGAGHASATGRFDDEQLFYLMSRGISAVDARRLVVRGFFAELIRTIDSEEIRDHLLKVIESDLSEGQPTE